MTSNNSLKFQEIPDYVNEQAINGFIASALTEDIGSGDHSSLASIPKEATNKAHLIVKENCTLAGVLLSEYIFKKVDPEFSLQFFKKDGEIAETKEIVFMVEGNARAILTAERLVLNCMQRMSGIATLTAEFVKQLEGTQTKILDTRKTTPNFRICEKWAVWIGGGKNHRYGLYDMIILKDNHVDFSGGIGKAIDSTKEYLQERNLSLKIEIETRNLREVEEVLNRGGIDRIMLDNMSLEMMRDAVKMIGGRYETEASGGVTLDRVRAIADTGVNFISAGALTHSAKNIDLSLKAFK